MEISLADERAFLLQSQLSMEVAQGRAWEHKADAFGRMVKMTKFFTRPNDDEFKLIYKEHRYEPFWHIVCRARYVYERQRDYEIKVAPEVESVTANNINFKTPNGRLIITAIEHCREEPRQELFIDGITGETRPTLSSYLAFPANEVPQNNLDDISAEGPIFVPPQARASGIVRNVLSNMIKGVQADRVFEEVVQVEKVDLYYRPVYAFQFRWQSKDKEAILEYDGVTAEMQGSGRTFQQYVGKMLEPEFLFDVGVETVSMLVPGGGLALKLAKQGIEVARSRDEAAGKKASRD